VFSVDTLYLRRLDPWTLGLSGEVGSTTPQDVLDENVGDRIYEYQKPKEIIRYPQNIAELYLFSRVGLPLHVFFSFYLWNFWSRGPRVPPWGGSIKNWGEALKTGGTRPPRPFRLLRPWVKLIRHLRSKTTHFQCLVPKHKFWLEWLASLCANNMSPYQYSDEVLTARRYSWKYSIALKCAVRYAQRKRRQER